MSGRPSLHGLDLGSPVGWSSGPSPASATIAMAVGAIRSEPGAPGAPGAPGSLFKIPVGSQSSGYPQGEQKISGVLDLFFYPGVGHFCVITPGHFSIDVSNRRPGDEKSTVRIPFDVGVRPMRSQTISNFPFPYIHHARGISPVPDNVDAAETDEVLMAQIHCEKRTPPVLHTLDPVQLHFFSKRCILIMGEESPCSSVDRARLPHSKGRRFESSQGHPSLPFRPAFPSPVGSGWSLGFRLDHPLTENTAHCQGQDIGSLTGRTVFHDRVIIS